MKKMVCIGIIGFVVFLAGCALTIESNSGTVLSVNEQGRFTEDLSYYMTTGGMTITMTLKKDGSFEFYYYLPEDTNINVSYADLDRNGTTNEGILKLVMGTKAEYSYVLSNYLLTISNIQSYTSSNVSTPYYWDSSDISRQILTCVFTTKKYYMGIYVKDGENSWKNTTEDYYTNSTTSKTYKTFSIDTTAKTYGYNSDSTQYDINNAIATFDRTTYSTAIVTNFPTGELWEKGKTITFNIDNYKSIRTRLLGNGTTNIQTNTTGASSATWFHGGDFIFNSDNVSYKAIEEF